MSQTTSQTTSKLEDLQYLHGFGNEHESEALAGALPQGQFSPQKVAYGLYAEQFSSTAFTAPRAHNRRTWMYRIRPSVVQGEYQALDCKAQDWVRTAPIDEVVTPPSMMRWDAPAMPTDATDFIDSWVTMAANGSAAGQSGVAVHTFCANQDMAGRFFCNADGELLIVPQQGSLLLFTECGKLHVPSGYIAVIPRGMKFKVELPEGQARGYICENYGSLLELPERGPVGANGYANDRDFQYPTAAFEDIEGNFELVTKYGGHYYRCDISHSPLDVVAWVGTSAPYRYELARFNVMNTVSFDHPDPSIFTVLTSASGAPGVANLDFVIFPPRWMVAEDTFRPPWYHRNVMSEFMGLIEGVYDAKEDGFTPGGCSLHNSMSPHGPEAAVFEKASTAELEPVRYKDTMAFMFESRYAFNVSKFALEGPLRQHKYPDCWKSLKKFYNGDIDAGIK